MHIRRNHLLCTILASLIMAVNPGKKIIDDGECSVCDDDDLDFPFSVIDQLDQLEMSLHNTTKVREAII